ncbi:MAG: TerB family tellurite resistance protein, partial [Candidatus Riflebacteria bacterium]|nr:TerB family tellurite resistance protein [Candidatus Riflebacteria bacterium]
MDDNQNINNNISPTDQINWLSAMMSVDNDVNEKEYKVILAYGLQLGMEEAKIKRIVTTSLKGMDILMRYLKVINLPKNENLMRALIKVVFADGKIAKEELEMIRLVATKMKYTNEELKVILEDEKR